MYMYMYTITIYQSNKINKFCSQNKLFMIHLVKMQPNVSFLQIVCIFELF